MMIEQWFGDFTLNLKEQDFLKVFDEFNTARRKAFDGRIPVDIFERTKG